MLGSYTVTRSPSHAAVVACGSIVLWCMTGVTYVGVTRTAAWANAASGSPRTLSVSSPQTLSGLTAAGRSANRSTFGGSASYATRTSDAACVARSSVSATTTATGSPAYATRSSCIGSRCCPADPASWFRPFTFSATTISCSFGNVSCVSTASTPGDAAAAAVSIAVTRPAETVLTTSTPWTSPGRPISATNLARPVTFSTPSTRGSGRPTFRASVVMNQGQANDVAIAAAEFAPRHLRAGRFVVSVRGAGGRGRPTPGGRR